MPPLYPARVESRRKAGGAYGRAEKLVVKEFSPPAAHRTISAIRGRSICNDGPDGRAVELAVGWGSSTVLNLPQMRRIAVLTNPKQRVSFSFFLQLLAFIPSPGLGNGSGGGFLRISIAPMNARTRGYRRCDCRYPDPRVPAEAVRGGQAVLILASKKYASKIRVLLVRPAAITRCNDNYLAASWNGARTVRLGGAFGYGLRVVIAGNEK